MNALKAIKIATKKDGTAINAKNISNDESNCGNGMAEARMKFEIKTNPRNTEGRYACLINSNVNLVISKIAENTILWRRALLLISRFHAYVSTIGRKLTHVLAHGAGTAEHSHFSHAPKL